MIALRAAFDGTQIILPPEASGCQPGPVIVVFDDEPGNERGVDLALMAALEATLPKVWDNPDDAIYDDL